MEKVLLDTNIIIHRERENVLRDDIGKLFNRIDSKGFKKCIHPLSIKEINRHQNAELVRSMSVKMESYYQLKTIAPLHATVKAMAEKMDKTENDRVDTQLLNEVYQGRVEYLISEDKNIHAKAVKLGISNKVFRIVTFITKAMSEDIEMVDYEVLSVKKKHFGEVDLEDPFFETFRHDYPGFDRWFHKKSDEIAYVSLMENVVAAFLFLKVEDITENYQDINPILAPKRRLKIGTFKVASNGIRLGERFLKIVFDNARHNKVEEIYVTIFDSRAELRQLIELLRQFGFIHHGIKTSAAGTEEVYVRNFAPDLNLTYPKRTYPFTGSWLNPKANRVFIVPINPEYHTKLFPDSILRTEKKILFDDSKPYRHSISKAYISRSVRRDLKAGDIIVFYRKGEEGTHKWHTSTVTTVGIVESVHQNLQTLEELKQVSHRKTVLNDNELEEWWNYNPKNRPFVVNFLYVHSFKRKPNLRTLVEELGVISSVESVPRGFEEIGWDKLDKLLKYERQ